MKRTRIDSTDRNPGPALPDRLMSGCPEVVRMLARIDQGYTPNVIEMMSILSEVVVFSTEDDINTSSRVMVPEFMSQKKCRFCD